MSRLSKVTRVLVALSVLWLGGVFVLGTKEASRFDTAHEMLKEDRWFQCTKAGKNDCDVERDTSDEAHTQFLHSLWITISAWAVLPPSVVLFLSWLIFDRKRKQPGA